MVVCKPSLIPPVSCDLRQNEDISNFITNILLHKALFQKLKETTFLGIIVKQHFGWTNLVENVPLKIHILIARVFDTDYRSTPLLTLPTWIISKFHETSECVQCYFAKKRLLHHNLGVPFFRSFDCAQQFSRTNSTITFPAVRSRVSVRSVKYSHHERNITYLYLSY